MRHPFAHIPSIVHDTVLLLAIYSYIPLHLARKPQTRGSRGEGGYMASAQLNFQVGWDGYTHHSLPQYSQEEAEKKNR
jgi:hypothetical protein